MISEWLNGKGHPLSSYRGKVVVIEFFQLWCPGCNKFSIPLMKEWSNKFKNNKNIIFISIHTVFEGHSFQNPKRLKKFVKEKKIKHLVGIDKHGLKGRLPLTMQKYRTGGTPAMAIIDKKGIIRFKYFGTFQKEPVEKLINLLLQEKYKK